MLTYSDFEKADDKAKFVLSAISTYRNSDEYRMAEIADEYDAQRNVTIQHAIRKLYTASGAVTEDPTVANNRIGCNLFNRLNTQRCMYSLGNGVTFIDPYEAAKGMVDETKELLGRHFDHVLREAGYHALIHGWSYLFWDLDKVHEFTMREFVPLVDEYDGSLRAGIRFWQLDSTRPMNAVLYEQDGYTTYQTGTNGGLVETKPKTAYKVTYVYTEADDDALDVIEENYSSLPIVRMYGSRLKQSTLVGMREAIDSYDLIQSGFANDLSDCAQIFWLVENYGGTGAGLAADARANLGFNASNLTSENLNALIGSTETKSYYGGDSNTVKNKPDGVDAFSLTVLRSADGWTSQVLVSSDQNPGIYYRSISSSTVQPWKRIYDYNSPLPVANGGTGATDAAQARANIGAAAANHSHSNYLTTSGTAAAASKLATARTISLAGDVTGSANFDGSANISITSNIAAGTVGANELASNAVTNAKIAADSVTLTKLGSDVGTVAVQSSQPSDTNVKLWIQI